MEEEDDDDDDAFIGSLDGAADDDGKAIRQIFRASVLIHHRGDA